MSTRASIRIIDDRKNEEKWMYHHTNGYPEFLGIMIAIQLSKLCWNEWNVDNVFKLLTEKDLKHPYMDYSTKLSPICGAGDENFIYSINCNLRTLTCYNHCFDERYEDCMKRDRIEMFIKI